MKKSVISFCVSGLVLASLAIWQIQSAGANETGELLQFAIIILLVSVGVYVGLKRLRSARAGEPDEDEMTKKILEKSAAISFKVSLFLWLALMYVADKGIYETDVVFGWGIIGMGVVFVVSALVLTKVGIKE